LRKHPFRESEAKRSVTRNKAKQTLRNAEQALSGLVQRIHEKQSAQRPHFGHLLSNSSQIHKIIPELSEIMIKIIIQQHQMQS
jgi:hypothetical protein